MDESKKDEVLDVHLDEVLSGIGRQLKRLWPLVLALIVLCAALKCFLAWRSYRPMYKAEAAFSVSVDVSGTTDILSYNYYYDNAAAKQAADTFPYLLSTDAMTELIKQELGTDAVNGTISASSVADTNFFILTVTSPSAKDAYDILNAVMDVYPQISRRVIGETQLVVSREPAQPTAPYNSLSFRRPAATGAVIGALISLFILLLASLLRRTVRSSSDVRALVNLQCLAKVPELPRKRRGKDKSAGLVITRQSSDSPLNEAMRLLKLKLGRELSPSGAKVVMFTSTLPAEGKSTLAVNTALSLAADGKKVLLIDADLRTQAVKPSLGITVRSKGLADCLGKDRARPEFIRCENTSLYLLAGDERVANPVPLLRRGALKELTQSLRAQFDCIVLDTPPCGMMADAALLCRCADKIVYVIREDFAPRAQIYDSIDTLHANGADICGYILNRVPSTRRSGYGYGYGYKSGYGYKHYKYGYGSSAEH